MKSTTPNYRSDCRKGVISVAPAVGWLVCLACSQPTDAEDPSNASDLACEVDACGGEHTEARLWPVTLKGVPGYPVGVVTTKSGHIAVATEEGGLAMLGPDGQPLWAREAHHLQLVTKPKEWARFTGVAAPATGRLVAVGHTWTGAGSNVALLLCVSDAGAVVWRSDWPALDSSGVDAITGLPDGDVVVAAYHKDSVGQPAPGQVNEHRIVRVDSQGEVVWLRPLSGTGSAHALDVSQSGEIAWFGFQGPKGTPAVGRIDLAGKVLGVHELPGDPEIVYPHTALWLGEGLILMATVQGFSGGLPASNGWIRITRTDSEGKALWKREIKGVAGKSGILRGTGAARLGAGVVVAFSLRPEGAGSSVHLGGMIHLDSWANTLHEVVGLPAVDSALADIPADAVAVDSDSRIVLAGRGSSLTGGWVAALGPWGHGSVAAGGKCAVLSPSDCDDKNPCTVDWCEPAQGCRGRPSSDGAHCHPEFTCVKGACVP